jgi:molecular chaperone DnaK
MISLGVDYGTSTTVLAACTNGKLDVLADDKGEDITASVVAFPPTGRTQIGSAARSRIVVDPENTLHSVKRILGKLWHSPEMRKFRDDYPFQLVRDSPGTTHFVTRAGKLTPEDTVARLLAHMRGYRSVSSRTFTDVVVAVPESADEAQVEATKAAVCEAGFAHPETVSEPAAAVLPYVLGEQEPHKLLVYDLGGGTFDAAVVRWDGRRPVVVSWGGESYLGGDDIDRRCAEWVVQQVLREHRWDISSNVKSFQTLVYLCERAKIRLSFAEQTALSLNALDEVLRDKRVVLERAVLRQITNDLIDRTFQVCVRVMNDAGLARNDLDAVVLVGGSTYAPFVRARVKEWFGGEVTWRLPADRLVAMGAALLAYHRASSP